MKRTWTDEDLTVAVAEAYCRTDVMRKLGLSISGSSFGIVKDKIKELGLDTSHFDPWKNNRNQKPSPIENYLGFSDTRVKGQDLKRRLLKEGLKEDLCEVCQQGPNWNGDTLVLQLDHINGNRLDNRLENLRIICPNCHSQTETFRGRRGHTPPAGVELSKFRGPRAQCADCYAWITKGATRCNGCDVAYKNLNRFNTDWPPVEEVVDMLSKSSFVGVGRSLGVSDNAVRKYLRRNGVGA